MYYDLLVKIRNAEQARRKFLRIPYSRMDFAIAKILIEAAYLKDAKKRVVGKKSFLDIELPPEYNDYKVIENFKFVSKPSRRVYVGYRSIRPARQGYGLAVVSTSSGVMTSREAKKRKLGGEYLFEIW